ncbi:radical SAM protein [Veillonellaceae bacterium WCA-693-APC-5D-A]|uniref:Radical SAM protein n=1 Tax=Anaerovibrio slackiae TaxID=2652309 RepID=A0A6I2UAN9_9FIRM|nr:radical SAM protein [Anaerovibrio slackiae]MSU07777.1 radical SAM protein [Anaerovibrio slackiae]
MMVVYINSYVELKKQISKKTKYIIYGAGKMGRLLFSFMHTNDIDNELTCFLETQHSNDYELFAKKVYSLATIPKEYLGGEYSVIIATSEDNHESMLNAIQKFDFGGIYCLKNNFFKEIAIELRREKYKYWNDRLQKNVERITDTSKENGVLLITPPYWDVYAPFSAVPSLVAAMKQKFVEVEQLDLGIECFHVAIREFWGEIAQRFISERYYDMVVSQYHYNPYNTYEDYKKDVWFFSQDSFPFREIKQRSCDFNKIQLGVLTAFYDEILNMESSFIDFDSVKSIIDDEDNFLCSNLFETILQEKIWKRLTQKRCLYGISVTSVGQFLPACKIAKLIKRIHKGAKVVIGGSCVDVFLRSDCCCKIDLHRYFDYVIVGEGESALCSLYDYSNNVSKGIELDIMDIPNLAFIDANNIVKYTTSVLEDVEGLSVADYDDLDLDMYVSPKLILPYQASRGCHYGYCAFCNHDEKYRHNYRPKTAKKIVEDLVLLKKKYGVTDIQFVDEAIRPDQFEKMVYEMAANLEFKHINWIYYSRVSLEYNKDMLKKAYANGCRMVMFGIETFNQRLLNFIKKGINSEASKYCIKLFHENKIKVYAWMLCNLPSETLDELCDDIDEVKNQMKYLDAVAPGIFRLEKNTDMYNNYSKYNILSIDNACKERFVSHNNGEIIDQDGIKNCFQGRYVPLISKYFFSCNRYDVYFSK